MCALNKIKDNNKHCLAGKKIILGFDGFVDTVAKIINQKDGHHTKYFDTILEFGNYTVEKSNKNFSLELETSVTKLGGNMPIMANALTRLGTDVSCLGPMGYPSLHPVFKSLAGQATLYSFGDPGLSTALEFNDGKILLAQMADLNKVTWSTVKDVIGLNTLIKAFTHRDLIAVLNWSELDHSTSLWKGLLEDILPKIPILSVKPIGFFDLSDCSKRSEACILEALELLKSFGKYWKVALSLNLNETALVYKALTKTSFDEQQVESAGEKLRQRLGVDTVVIHYSNQALAWNGEGMCKCESKIITHPLISTGAGDNFNAGFCAGRLMEFDLTASLALGHTLAGNYMMTGQSPTPDQLISSH